MYNAKNGQTHLKNLTANTAIFLKRLTILGHHASNVSKTKVSKNGNFVKYLKPKLGLKIDLQC